MKLHLQYALVCDDVRREDNGKLILIGVYGRDIRVLKSQHQTGAFFLLSVVVSCVVEEPGEGDVSIRHLVNGVPKAEHKGKFHVPDEGATLVTVPHIPIELEGTALVEFQWKRTPDLDWEPLTQIPVIFHD